MSESESSRLARVEDLFHRAADLPAAERELLLEPVRRSDPELAAEVERLLARADGGRDLSAVGALLPTTDASDSLVGPYRLLERIGQGGMGEVYRAERADGQYDQIVAVKLIRAGATAPELADRFRAERQILARLEHPNIARLLDGGMTSAGSPYLVMEYAPGRPITEHCDARKLGIDERIELFLTVCRAVAHAHRNLIVHRDLKPSNILVTEGSSEGDRVKLLDFGIAKLLETGEPEGPELTRTLAPMMTPGYASPEQVRGEAVTTATDVYSLGLLLYELLAGRRAQIPKDHSLRAIERAICEEGQQAPSSALATGSATEVAVRVAERGGGRPARLRQRLSGDLDVIVATALRKDPIRRYASAERLGEDLERHLAGRPVEARPDSFPYRMRKFLGRHRLGVAATAAVAAAVVAGLILALVGLGRARAAEERALEEAGASGQIAEFLVGMFRANDPGEALGETLTARDLLDRGAERVDDELADQPAVRSRLLGTMARAYESLGLYEPAIELGERRLAIENARSGEQSVEAAKALNRLSTLYRKRADYSRARDLAERAIQTLERTPEAETGPVQQELANALNRHAESLAELGELERATAAGRRALAIRERFPEPRSGLRTALNNLAVLHWRRGETEDALGLYQRATDIAREEFGPDHPEIANITNNLALVHEQRGDRAQAISSHEKALAIRERVLAPEHPDLAESLNNLGDLLRRAGEVERGRQMLERAVTIREKVLGPEHDYVGYSLNNLALAHLDLDQPEAARPLFERTKALFERKFGANHVLISYPTSGLARIAEAAGDMAAAESGFIQVLDIRRNALGEAHPLAISAIRDYAHFLRNRGRDAEAAARDAEADALETR